MNISLYRVDPFESALNLKKVTSILNSCSDIKIVYKGSVSGDLPDEELGKEYFDRCLSRSGDEYAIFLTSRPLDQGWFVLRNHLNMNDYSFVKQDKKWIAVTIDYIEDLAQLKDLDINRLCAFNIFKAIVSTELLYKGLSYIGDIYPGLTTIEDSSFIFCRTKSDFVTAYRLGKLGSRLENVLTRNNIPRERINYFKKGLEKIKENQLQNYIRIRNMREYSHNIFISVFFGTIASLIATYLYVNYLEAERSSEKSEIAVREVSDQKTVNTSGKSP